MQTQTPFPKPCSAHNGFSAARARALQQAQWLTRRHRGEAEARSGA